MDGWISGWIDEWMDICVWTTKDTKRQEWTAMVHGLFRLWTVKDRYGQLNQAIFMGYAAANALLL